MELGMQLVVQRSHGAIRMDILSGMIICMTTRMLTRWYENVGAGAELTTSASKLLRIPRIESSNLVLQLSFQFMIMISVSNSNNVDIFAHKKLLFRTREQRRQQRSCAYMLQLVMSI